MILPILEPLPYIPEEDIVNVQLPIVKIVRPNPKVPSLRMVKKKV